MGAGSFPPFHYGGLMQHRVTMLHTTLAADYDGINPRHYLKGRSYTISDYLLGSFISMGVIKIDQGQADGTYEFNTIDDYEDKAIKGKRGRPKKNEKN